MCFLFPLYRRWIKTDTAVTYVKECCSMFSSKNFIESGLAFRFLIRFELFLCMVLVQLVSHVRLFVTPWTGAARLSCPSPSPRVCSDSWPSSHLVLCRPLLLLPSIFLSIRVFSNDLALHIRWPKYGNFSISPSKEYSGLITFRMDWLDLLAVQGTLKSLLQHHSSKASILWRSAFFMVQLSHSYMTTGKTTVLTRPLSAK